MPQAISDIFSHCLVSMGIILGAQGIILGVHSPPKWTSRARTQGEETFVELGSKHIPDSTTGSKLFNGDRHKTNASPTCVDSCSTRYQRSPYISAFPEY